MDIGYLNNRHPSQNLGKFRVIDLDPLRRDPVWLDEKHVQEVQKPQRCESQ